MKWELFKNPYVIAAGVGIGALILLTRGSGSSDGGNADAAIAVGAFERNNMAAMALAGQIAEVDAKRQMALSSDQTTLALGVMQTLGALRGAAMNVQAQLDQANIAARVNADNNRAAYQLEDLQGRNRFALGQLDSSTILKSLAIEAGRSDVAIDQPTKPATALDTARSNLKEISNSWSERA